MAVERDEPRAQFLIRVTMVTLYKETVNEDGDYLLIECDGLSTLIFLIEVQTEIRYILYLQIKVLDHVLADEFTGVHC